jgi:crotonobetainyl-CoA:carnitine CoA-transferase CaiB-like acyl-CoA transferase
MRPLDGIVVLDFSTLLPGPMATATLAAAGAEVIKVERPGGEDMRRFPPRAGETSTPYVALNAGKKIVEIDLKAKDALEELRPLIARADVVVEQFRPGVMARLGLGYAALSAFNPRLVYCSITGYGQTGPRAEEAGHDINYQARAGLLAQALDAEVQAPNPPALVADIAGGAMAAVINILMALRARDASGRGCHLDIAMHDAMASFLWFGLAEASATGRWPQGGRGLLTGGSPRYQLYRTRDGRHLAVGALEEKFWTVFCEAIGLSAELRDAKAPPEAATAAIAAIIAEREAAHWRALLEPLDCCCTLAATLEEAAADPHWQARGLTAATAELPGGASVVLAPVPLAPVFRTAGRSGPEG